MTFFRHNRVYLLGAIILSLLLPAIAPYIVMSEEQIPVVHWSYIAAEMENVYVRYDAGYDYETMLWAGLKAVYGIGVLVVLARMIFGLRRIYQYYCTGDKDVKNGFNIITTDAVHLPFSFFKSVYISRHIPLSDHVQTILEHEEIHIKHWHTVDVLFAEAIQAFFWFNPVMILYKRALRQAHEYLADDIICSKNSISSYTELLLSKSQTGIELALTNQFFHSQIKKRIQMMTKNKTNRNAAWKYALVLPLLMGLVVLFSSSTAKQQLQDVVSGSHDSIPKPPAPPPPPAPHLLHGNALMPEGVMAIIVDEAFIKVDLKNGVSKYYYKNNASDMQEFENFYGKIPSHDIVPPPPPPIPNLINTDPERFAKELGFDKNPLYVVDNKVYKQDLFNIDPSDVLSITVMTKSCHDINEIVKKYGKQAENGVVFIYTKSYKGSIQEEPEKEIFKIVEQMPRFPGCENEPSQFEKKDCSNRKMLDYIAKHLKYPSEAKDKSIEGTVVAQFTINKDGSVSDINIIRDIGGGCGQAVIEMLKTMNDMPEKWLPGKQAGKNVNVLYTLPVKFKMTDDQPIPKVVEKLPKKSEEESKKEAFKTMLEMAAFPGSENETDPMKRLSGSFNEMTKFIQKRLKYPSKAKENNIEGPVYIRITIDANGKVTDAMIKEDIGFGCGEEALRVVRMMPNWFPATKDGKAVASTQTISISFKLKGYGNKSPDLNTEDRFKNSIEPQHLNIYPNPTSDLIELSLQGSKEDVEVSILDLSGKLLYKNKFDNRQESFKTKIDISQINVPTILVKTVQGNKVSTKQIVIRI